MLLVFPVAGTGCYSATNAAATSEYTRQVATAQMRVAQMEEKLATSAVQLRELQDLVRTRSADEAVQLENLDQVNDEVTRLRGDIEVLQFEASELKRLVTEAITAQEDRQVYDELRLDILEKTLGLSRPAPVGSDPVMTGPEQVDGAADAGSGSVDVPATAGEKLELAAGHMEDGKQVIARAVLSAAQNAHAGEPEMAEIRYRIAETYYNEASWKKSISEFNKVINNHPGTDWACWSYYRQGEAFEELGQSSGAKAFFRGATEGACKSSDAAKEAKKKL